jgi:hypothetical protein
MSRVPREECHRELGKQFTTGGWLLQEVVSRSLSHRITGFAGVHPRKRSLILNLRLDQALTSFRVVKVEQVSKHRYHNEVKLENPEHVDNEIADWLRAAYALGA